MVRTWLSVLPTSHCPLARRFSPVLVPHPQSQAAHHLLQLAALTHLQNQFVLTSVPPLSQGSSNSSNKQGPEYRGVTGGYGPSKVSIQFFVASAFRPPMFLQDTNQANQTSPENRPKLITAADFLSDSEFPPTPPHLFTSSLAQNTSNHQM